ncbi:type II toxin-antitoxin system HicB family antitoxin [Xanthomonas perforans]|uniref:type II toxin-antitoxin system HicB family antitoxin n=1 Tax=Xanthomonas perforans TaxID=442694 RepID=UPI000F8EDDCC|nr:type II toxin-antitoxin system HicB family antitoxin [Xanthomonas perforans]MDS6449128.1 type II toxin-antitoxin system HicB family antitoxin [Xanthomonas perforans]MDS6452722.1 type II toxin-antitoxin system HicB family antitoxin [Xanthomonas perforans]MDS6458338.1 type II toxin-antitoxin system HicB family antitoxin [Xanthomonas perforans]MDS6464769.1 type II toxin-antitoxin system HicB family antitoxin [Xanthomonas perforans]MDS6469009.1 type II toxin-antitoxin system HicB family antitox
MTIREIKFQVRGIIEPDGDLFHAYAPDLNGVHACGETPEEASLALHEGIQLYFASLVKHNEPMPVGLIALDRVHNNEVSMVWTLVKERFLRPRRKSYVEEITLSTGVGRELATC